MLTLLSSMTSQKVLSSSDQLSGLVSVYLCFDLRSSAYSVIASFMFLACKTTLNSSWSSTTDISNSIICFDMKTSHTKIYVMQKKSVEQAIKNYLSKQDRKSSKPKRKNQKPEKQVEAQVLEWCRSMSWFVSVVESKAVYSKSAGRYLSGQVAAGFPDIVGVTQNGLFVAIELKAPGKRASVRESQLCYLKNVIDHQGFAAVVDSVEYLESLYTGFLHLENGSGYLHLALPAKRQLETSLFQIA